MLTSCGGASSTGESQQGNQSSQNGAGHTSVLTQLNDNFRDGLNLTETKLTPGNVTTSTFGRLPVFLVQGYVYAQPLYVPSVTMAGGKTANLLVVATEHDQIYAFDVDSRTQVWHVDYLASGPNVSTLSQDDVMGCGDLVPEIGITSTPVVDATTGTIYVLVRTKETVNDSTTYYQRLHAVDLSTGSEVISPTVVSSPPPGYAATGLAIFDPLLNNQRAALLLANNQVYVAWASHCDMGKYMGWLISFDEHTLQPTAY